MSADIWMFLERRKIGEDLWIMVGDSELVFPRDYYAFSCFLGKIYALDAIAGFIAPRGIPEDLSLEVLSRHFFKISDKTQYSFPEGVCVSVSRQDADLELKNGKYKELRGHLVGGGCDYTWLTCEELQDLLVYCQSPHFDQAPIRQVLEEMRKWTAQDYLTRLFIEIR